MHFLVEKANEKTWLTKENRCAKIWVILKNEAETSIEWIALKKRGWLPYSEVRSLKARLKLLQCQSKWDTLIYFSHINIVGTLYSKNMGQNYNCGSKKNSRKKSAKKFFYKKFQGFRKNFIAEKIFSKVARKIFCKKSFRKF